jgi:aspartate/methionine/tyrosine aminotransferase
LPLTKHVESHAADVWVDFSECKGVGSDKVIFQRLLELGLAVVPGSAFSMPSERRLVRLSCAQASFDALDEAIHCVDQAVGEWCGGR